MSKLQRLEEVIRIRLPHYHEDFPIILFWSQKSGCTSLLKWFYDQIGILEEVLHYNPWVHYYDSQVFKRRPGYKDDIINNILLEKKDIYKLVRDPYRRAVSQFLILATAKGSSHWENEWKKVRKFFYNNPMSERGITFKQFLQYIRDAKNYDNHFAPQYVPGEEEFVRKYIYLENFNKQMKKIEKKYHLKKSNLLELTTSSHHFSSNMVLEGDFANIEISEYTFSNERKFPKYTSFYDEEAIQLVNTVFAKDFEIYGYRKLNKPFM